MDKRIENACIAVAVIVPLSLLCLTVTYALYVFH